MSLPVSGIRKLLIDLDPSWSGGILVIDCPCGKCGGRVRIPTTLAPMSNELKWEVSGEWPDLTLTPSVDAGCWHGFIAGGVAH